MRFSDRVDAGKQLAAELRKFADDKPLIAALPRGGVVLGAVIAAALEAPLSVIITRKIGHPENPEYAVCAIGESGSMVCNEAERATIDQRWLTAAMAKEQAEAARRRRVYIGRRRAVPLTSRTVIIVDDGVATGLTLRAAIKEARRDRPKKLVVAVPVAPADTATVLRREADELVVLDIDQFYLGSVGAYYDDFPQISDDEVISLLRQTKKE